MIDDARLIAYVDGELDARGRAEVEASLAADPLLASRLARHRELKIRLARTFDPVALEATPERLRVAAGGRGQAGPDNIVRLADRRNPPKVKTARNWKWPSWSPIAASLAVGAVAGYGLSHQNAGPLASRPDGALAARGDLAQALERNPAGVTGPIKIGLSFRTADRYCRTFQMDARRLAGVACKEGPGWVARMTTVAVADAPPPGYRTAASSISPAVLTAVGQMMVGQSLDKAGEDAARARGWRR